MATNIGIGKAAPLLAFEGDKWDNRDTYNKKERPNGCFFGQQPQEIMYYVMNELTGQQGNMLKLMWLLLSTDVGYGVSQQWVLNSTGMQKDKYYDARSILVEIGWLLYEEQPSGPALLGINYTFLWQQAKLPKNERIKTQVKIKEAKQKLGIK